MTNECLYSDFLFIGTLTGKEDCWHPVFPGILPAFLAGFGPFSYLEHNPNIEKQAGS